MKLVFTLAARVDLHDIGNFIAEDDPHRAIAFVSELERYCRKLTTMPRAHPVLHRHEARGIRKATHGNYLIFTVCRSMRSKLSTSSTVPAIGNGCCSMETRLANEGRSNEATPRLSCLLPLPKVKVPAR